ncbi:MAG: hypothetical protein B7Z66_03715 [Chromatiales bacterium 21-64-14]|nr:MAG: hypothetical protein B7Z66_03715 [Chromatiales bacterium 21-64-14]HQU14814.1 DoxX family protein [Gammaproteobacteria bacterium]
MDAVLAVFCAITGILNRLGTFLPQLGLRLLLAWEFWVSGTAKLHSANWFVPLQSQFPLPFSLLPANATWFLVTWAELLGAVALLMGFGTRLAALAFMVLDAVAWHTLYAGNGYNVCDGGYKLALLYLAMLLPLLFGGPGTASVDHWISRRL